MPFYFSSRRLCSYLRARQSIAITTVSGRLGGLRPREFEKVELKNQRFVGARDYKIIFMKRRIL
ncbi:unnamed protein product [Protopolystoma xenopodis]|uniref:Uncharacterized protein n=1 Tax=Protopolystoma xenopodis TaxID=117903 RepID=A0A3S5FDW2_9PLAT|nr:unnamed protein product [Protopolystoma xenopodis]